VRPRVSDDLVVANRDPGVGCERGLVHRPPAAQLVPSEADRIVLSEVGAIPRKKQRGDAVCIVQRRSA
jgi:hypothetical protein